MDHIPHCFTTFKTGIYWGQIVWMNVKILRQDFNIFQRLELAVCSVVGHVLGGGRELGVALDHLMHSIEEVLLCGNLPSRPDGKHASLSADAAQLSTSGVRTQSRQQLVPNVLLDAHRSCMNFENVCPSVKVWQRELHLPIQPSWPHQGRVKCVWSVCCHQHLDVAARVKAVQLVDKLQHGSLNLIVTSSTIVKPSSSHCVNLVKEDEASLLCPGHLKELTDHPGALAHILLHQF